MSIKTQIHSIIYDNNLLKYQKLSKILKIIIDYCNINNNKYMIIGSYSIRKYREINDLDLNMYIKEWNKLTKLININIGISETYNNQIRYFLDMTDEYKKFDSKVNDFSIEIFKKKLNEGFPNNNFSIKNLLKNNGLDRDENNHLYFNKKSLLEWKKIMNREKNQGDIRILEYLIKNKIVNTSQNIKIKKKKITKKNNRKK